VNAIACVVLHATADGGDEAGAESWMRNPASQASAHLHIRRSGTVVRLVSDQRRAWHAGTSRWRGRMDVNDFSLRWELALPQGRKSDPAGFLWARFYEGIRRRLFYSGAGSLVGNPRADPG
jgi:N-acetyl-anhydromuramyl-L-alanine amidase AmpD